MLYLSYFALQVQNLLPKDNDALYTKNMHHSLNDPACCFCCKLLILYFVLHFWVHTQASAPGPPLPPHCQHPSGTYACTCCQLSPLQPSLPVVYSPCEQQQNGSTKYCSWLCSPVECGCWSASLSSACGHSGCGMGHHGAGLQSQMTIFNPQD